MSYSQELWEEWSLKESFNYKLITSTSSAPQRKYLKKGYLHFDSLFWFPDKKEEIRKIISNNLKVLNTKNNNFEWWSFSPFIRILIKAPRFRYQESTKHFELETKIRPICFASHKDSLIFGYYSYILNKKYEDYIIKNNFSACVLAYRDDLKKSNIQFAKEVFDYTKSKGVCTAIALDIKGYFDHIDHIILKEKWAKILGGNLPDDQYKIYKVLTKYSYVNKTSLFKKYNIDFQKIQKAKKINNLLELINEGKKDFEKYNILRRDKLIVVNNKIKKGSNRFAGIPQGSALSALLSNIYLIDYDKIFHEKSIQENFIYRRYCDDILIICDTAKADELRKFAVDKIKEDYYLTIQDKKIETIDFRPNSKGIIRAFRRDKKTNISVETSSLNEQKYYKNLQYLGFEFNGQKIYIRPSSLSRYFRKMKSRIAKTVAMAYSPSGKSNKIFKEQLFHRYTHLGKRNFLKYAYNASKEKYQNSKKEWKEGMNSPSIRKQLRRHFFILVTSLISKNNQRFRMIVNKGKMPSLKKL